MIDIRHLERSYKTGAGYTWVLRRIDLKIERGEFVTLMGPSGAGKSSLLNAIALLDDHPAARIGEHRRIHERLTTDSSSLALT